MAYTFKKKQLPRPPANIPRLEAGMRQGVHFTCDPDELNRIVETLRRWFADRDDIILLDHGFTDKQELGVVVLEWEEHEIDPAFVEVLANDELVEDYTIYSHDLGEPQEEEEIEEEEEVEEEEVGFPEDEEEDDDFVYADDLEGKP